MIREVRTKAKEFNMLVQNGMNPNLAAVKTFTGTQAGIFGYTNTQIDWNGSVVNSDGTFSKVTVNFTKPKSK